MSSVPVLELDNVCVAVAGKQVCSNISLTINEDESHILLGPNGSGKSSLLNALMGIGPYSITSGSLRLCGTDITEADVAERARLGMGIAVQHPPVLPGVTVAKLAHAMHADDRIASAATELNLEKLVPREVNVGFSGGEAKRWEVMKLLLQQPRMCLFDEPESGVDLAHVAVVGKAIDRLLKTPTPHRHHRSALMITHTGFILDHVHARAAHLMKGGRIVASGPAREMFDSIRRDGFAA